MSAARFASDERELVQSHPWQREETFHDHLYQWLERAPWLAISFAAHFLVFLVLAAIPWKEFREDPKSPCMITTGGPEPYSLCASASVMNNSAWKSNLAVAKMIALKIRESADDPVGQVV